jgi:hypothetical protein
VSQQKIAFSSPYQSGLDLFTNQPLDVSQISMDAYQILWIKL